MRRSVIAILAVIVPCALLVTGCGEEVGNVQEAKEQIGLGNLQMKNISTDPDKLSTDPEAFKSPFTDLARSIEQFFTEYSEGSGIDPAAAGETMRVSRDRMEALVRQAEETKEPYKKVLAMKGVKEYKEYARLRLNTLEQVKRAEDVVDKAFTDMEKAIKTGEPPDKEALENAKRALIGIEEEFTFNDDEARDLGGEIGISK